MGNYNWKITTRDYARSIAGSSIPSSAVDGITTTTGIANYPSSSVIDGNRFSRWVTASLNAVELVIDFGSTRSCSGAIIEFYVLGGQNNVDGTPQIFYIPSSTWTAVPSASVQTTPYNNIQYIIWTSVSTRYLRLRWYDGLSPMIIDICKVSIFNDRFEMDNYDSQQTVQTGRDNYILMPASPSGVKSIFTGGKILRNKDGIPIRGQVFSKGYKRKWELQFQSGDWNFFNTLTALAQEDSPIGIITHLPSFFEGIIVPESIAFSEQDRVHSRIFYHGGSQFPSGLEMAEGRMEVEEI
jgi:hypothetical protein